LNNKVFFLGIDVGTTGVRAIAINEEGQIHGHSQTPMPAPERNGNHISQNPAIWQQAVTHTLKTLFETVPATQIRALAIDGTSSTLLRTDANGTPLGPALMYNDSSAREQAQQIAQVADPRTAAIGASSALAKLLWWQDQAELDMTAHVLQQADWIAGLFTNQWQHTDANNALKLGWDAENNCWPEWLIQLLIDKGIDQNLLPTVHNCGDETGTISSTVAKEYGLSPDTKVIAGTTDGVAAFIAAGATQPGQAVTSLGSTLILKLLSQTPVHSSEHGVYSHPLGKYWLAGGASNSGGSVLLQYFSKQQLDDMTPKLKPEQPTGMEYYPLPSIGERFPVCDPDKSPQLEPRPDDDVVFFQAMLEGMVKIEKQGYDLLADLGAPELSEVFTAGGGSHNEAWTKIRENVLGVPVIKTEHDEAAYGAALIATGHIGKVFG
jgi:sugar (pentulose or hexulose) kinase